MSCQAGKAGSAVAEDRLYHDTELACFYDHDNGRGDDDRLCLGPGADYTPDAAEIIPLGTRA